MSEPIRFRMRLADTVFAVSCTCPSTLERCRDYLAEDAPDHTIIPVILSIRQKGEKED